MVSLEIPPRQMKAPANQEARNYFTCAANAVISTLDSKVMRLGPDGQYSYTCVTRWIEEESGGIAGRRYCERSWNEFRLLPI